MPFMGMHGTGEFSSNQLPTNFAQFIMREAPNGMAQMFAMQGMFPEETVDSYKSTWWTKTVPTQAISTTAGATIYIDAGLATAYDHATHNALHGVAGKSVYVKVPLAFAQECKISGTIILRDSDQLGVDVAGRITGVQYDGANSYLTVSLLEDDDNVGSGATYNLATVDRLLLYGNAVPEGSVAPDAIGYSPVEYTNLVQEFRDTLDISDIMRATMLRTGSAYKELKRDTSELHSIAIEKTFFQGRYFDGTGENGKKLRTTQGLFEFLKANNPTNIVDFLTDTDSAFAGLSWAAAGKKFMDKYLADLFAYAPGEVMAFVGSDALLALNELAELYGNIQISTRQEDFGIKVTTWITPFGEVHMKTHPLFSHETTNRRLMVLLHPKNVRFAPLVGGGLSFRTKFEEDMQIPGQHSKVDGYYTAGMWKFYHPNQFMIMRNLGLDNAA